jgi:hypothetical protein
MQTADVTRQRSLVQVLLGTLAFGAATFFQAVGLRQGAHRKLWLPRRPGFTPTRDGTLVCGRRDDPAAAATWRYAASAAVLPVTAFLLLLRRLAGVVPIVTAGWKLSSLKSRSTPAGGWSRCGLRGAWHIHRPMHPIVSSPLTLPREPFS